MLKTVLAVIPALGFHEYAPTPPMGWNSWDCFGTAVTEQQTKENADYMAAHLARFGYEYVVVDIQWYEPNATGHDYVEGAKLTLDEYGRLLPAANKFPSSAGGAGFGPLGEYIHGKGLKFGIHLMRGVPREAVEKKLPILGTKWTAADIANVNDKCSWNPDMYGVDMSRPGAQEYYDSVFGLIASWGVDFVKVDDLSRPYGEHRPEIEAIRRAMDNTGRRMVLSMSPGETPLAEGEHAARHANMWRISDDFWDSWPMLVAQFERCANWVTFTGRGYWPDADMLPVGAVRVARDGWTKFTADEQYTMMTLWAMCRSPLMIGGHMPRNDVFTLALLTNEDVIEVNQHSKNGRQLWRRGEMREEVCWVAQSGDGRAVYVALFNLADRPAGGAVGKEMVVTLEELGLGGQREVQVRDLWGRRDLGPVRGSITAEVPWHGCVMYRVEAKR
jgi:hypothetical protein